MSSEMLIPQVTLADRDRSDSTAVDDDVAISVRSVGKMYYLYDLPQDRLKQAFLWGRKKLYREFWALRDVSFEVRQGESVGIIGRNGSGKSTLLQIIAGTLTPTTGEVRVNGRVAALLELGSGFNPEFTGRQNVYMHGAILGLSGEEIDERFDEIAAFADIGQFIDQPVKLYSSGMFARLAFAIAVSVDADVLIVDEILAVGDTQFQQKCVGRMREMREKGLTLLFVSHSIDQVKSLCNNAILLSQGQPLYIGTAEQTTSIYWNLICDEMNEQNQKYIQLLLSKPCSVSREPKGERRYGTGHVQIESVTLLDIEDQLRAAYRFGETVVLEVKFRCLIDVDHLSISFVVRDTTGIDLMGTTTFDERVHIPPKKEGDTGCVRLSFVNCLRIGSYGVSVALNRITRQDASDNILFDQIDGVAAFEVISDPSRPVHCKFYTPVKVVLE